MRYGFTLPGRGPLATPDNLAAIARRGEALGYHFVLVGDHIVVPRQIASPYPYTETGEFPGSASGVAMEQLTVLAFRPDAGHPAGHQRHHRAAPQPAGGCESVGDP